MESEKVKEIKKALDCCSVSCTDCPYDKGETTNPICINDLTKNALTLINELESENERLNKSDTSKEESSIKYYNLYKDLKRKNKDLNELCELQRVSIAENFVRENKLKDRIALLEKDNELLRNAKVVYENVDYFYEDLKKAEKRIAELEDGIAKSMLGCEFLPECTNDKLKQFAERLKERSYDMFKGSDIITIEDIDETLKEFICDYNQ